MMLTDVTPVITPPLWAVVAGLIGMPAVTLIGIIWTHSQTAKQVETTLLWRRGCRGLLLGRLRRWNWRV